MYTCKRCGKEVSEKGSFWLGEDDGIYCEPCGTELFVDTAGPITNRDRLMAAWMTLFDLEPLLPHSKASILYAARKIIGELVPSRSSDQATK